MPRYSKLQKFAQLETFPNVFRSKNHLEKVVNNHLNEELDIRGKWNEEFKNEGKLSLELACGKGHYARGLAQMYPDQNLIGVDLKGNRIWKGATEALENEEHNVRFLRCRIEFLEYFFAPGEVDEIWITFADPQLKKPKKRLTAARFLDVYRKVLKKDDNLVHLKTDSTELYESTLEVLEELNIPVLYQNDDIYAGELYTPELDIKTFYEEMHLEKGKTIKYLRFSL